jgi:hypothetical protein
MFYPRKGRSSKKNGRNNLKSLYLPGALEKKYSNTGKEWVLRGGFHAE